eukprot:2303861-Amphidinium_carterae.1
MRPDRNQHLLVLSGYFMLHLSECIAASSGRIENGRSRYHCAWSRSHYPPQAGPPQVECLPHLHLSPHTVTSRKQNLLSHMICSQQLKLRASVGRERDMGRGCEEKEGEKR